MSADAFRRLREVVFADPHLARRLAGAAGAEFADAVAALAAACALDVTSDDVERAIDEGRRSWSLRWIR